MTDAELVAAWRAGDRKAGSVLFERHYAVIVRFFRNKVGDGVAADLVQKTFLAGFEALAAYRGEASVRTYLFTIAYRLLCRHFAAQRRDRIDLTTVSAHDLGHTPSELLAARDEQRLLLAALRRIPVEYQVIIELHYWEQMTAADAAVVLGIPEGTAKTRLRRGRQLLEVQLGLLAAAPTLVTSTVRDLEAWAAALRERLGGPPGTGAP